MPSVAVDEYRVSRFDQTSNSSKASVTELRTLFCSLQNSSSSYAKNQHIDNYRHHRSSNDIMNGDNGFGSTTAPNNGSVVDGEETTLSASKRSRSHSPIEIRVLDNREKFHSTKAMFEKLGQQAQQHVPTPGLRKKQIVPYSNMPIPGRNSMETASAGNICRSRSIVPPPPIPPKPKGFGADGAKERSASVDVLTDRNILMDAIGERSVHGTSRFKAPSLNLERDESRDCMISPDSLTSPITDSAGRDRDGSPLSAAASEFERVCEGMEKFPTPKQNHHHNISSTTMSPVSCSSIPTTTSSAPMISPIAKYRAQASITGRYPSYSRVSSSTNGQGGANLNANNATHVNGSVSSSGEDEHRTAGNCVADASSPVSSSSSSPSAAVATTSSAIPTVTYSQARASTSLYEPYWRHPNWYKRTSPENNDQSASQVGSPSNDPTSGSNNASLSASRSYALRQQFLHGGKPGDLSRGAAPLSDQMETKGFFFVNQIN